MPRGLGTKDWTAGEVLTATSLDSYVGPPPNIVEIDVLSSAAAATNWSTRTQQGTYYYSGSINSSGAQNDSITFDVVLAAGTWKMTVVYVTGTTQGIHKFQLSTDGSTFADISASPYNASAATVDAYNNPGAANNFVTFTSITIATTGRYALRDLMDTKNGSASDYTGTLQHITLVRTA
jgi:hypothetical protein